MSRNARILLLNLKYAVFGGTWWWPVIMYGYAGFILWPNWRNIISDPEGMKGHYVSSIFSGIVWVVVVGHLQWQMIHRVAVFCLPGHKQVQKRVTLILGGTIGLISCWPLVLYPGLSLGGRILAVGGGLCLPLSCYLLILLLMLGGWRKKLFWLGVGTLLVVALICLITPKGADEVLTRWPLVFVVAGGSASILAWRCITNDEFIREVILHVEISAKQQRARVHQPAGVPSGIVDYRWAGAMEKCYSRQMARSGYSGKCVWGVLYSHLGPLSAYWNWTIAGIIISSVVLGYLAPFGGVVIFCVPALMTVFWKVPVYGSMLVLGGRRERWLSGMICSATLVVLLASVGLAICAFNRVMGLFMPSIWSRGEELEYLAINARLFWVPLILGPITFSIDTVTHRKPVAKWIIMIALLYGCVFVFGHFFEQIRGGFDGQMITAATVIVWLVFCVILWACCRMRNLVGQDKR